MKHTFRSASILYGACSYSNPPPFLFFFPLSERSSLGCGSPANTGQLRHSSGGVGYPSALAANTVLYRWLSDMDDETFLQHVLDVRSQGEVPLERLGLPLHPESQTCRCFLGRVGYP